MSEAGPATLGETLLPGGVARGYARYGGKAIVPVSLFIGLGLGVFLSMQPWKREAEDEDPAINMAMQYMQAANTRQSVRPPTASQWSTPAVRTWHNQVAVPTMPGMRGQPVHALSSDSYERSVAAPATAAAAPSTMVDARFINEESGKKIQSAAGTPAYVYDEATLIGQAEKALKFPNAYGLTVRYAMKAAPNKAILKLFSGMGLHIDASSGYECWRAMQAGIPPSHMSLSSQEFPHSDFKALYEAGIEFNACSLNQLESFGKLFPGGSCGLRFNPGTGSGGTGKTNVGGPSSSFGIWYELMPDVKAIVEKYNLKIIRVHTHIGSGSDPKVWQEVSKKSIDLCRDFPDVVALNLGGGYKVGRMPGEPSTDMLTVGEPVVEVFKNFAKETGRELKLEIEPGTFLVANSCALLTEVRDIVTTGDSGYTFIKLDSGMTEVLRPSLYGAQHPITVVGEHTGDEHDYVVVGHCCESGDLFSCKPGDPESLDTRKLKKAAIGDLAVIDGSGAYCSGMSTKNYNSFPEAPEVMLKANGDVQVIRKRQTLEQILANELD